MDGLTIFLGTLVVWWGVRTLFPKEDTSSLAPPKDTSSLAPPKDTSPPMRLKGILSSVAQGFQSLIERLIGLLDFNQLFPKEDTSSPAAQGFQSLAERLEVRQVSMRTHYRDGLIIGGLENPSFSRWEYELRLPSKNTGVLELSVQLPPSIPLQLRMTSERNIREIPVKYHFVQDLQTGDSEFDDTVCIDGNPSYVRALLDDNVRYKVHHDLIARDDGGTGSIQRRVLTMRLPVVWDGVEHNVDQEDRIVDAVERAVSLAQLISERSAHILQGHNELQRRLRHNAETDECQAVRHNNLMTLIEETPKYLPPWPMTEPQALHLLEHSDSEGVILRAVERLETVGTLPALAQLRRRIERFSSALWMPQAKQALAAIEAREGEVPDGGLSLVDDADHSGDLSLADGGVDAGALDLIDVPTPENADEQGPESHQAPDGIKG